MNTVVSASIVQEASVVRAYRFALDPTPAQEQQLRSHCGAARCAFNNMLEVVKKNMDQRAHPSAQRRWKDSGLQGQRFIGRQHLHQEKGSVPRSEHGR